MADTAVMTGGAALVRLREDSGAADGKNAIVEMLRDSIAENHLRAVHFHRRQKFAVGELRQALGLAADAGVRFDVVVPRSHICVADRPIDGVAFFQVGLEVEVAPAVALASPR